MQDTVYISGLEPLIAPEKTGFWPPAPGWYLLALLVLLLILFLTIWFMRRYRQKRYRRLALADLSGLDAEAGDRPGQIHLQKLNHLLKHTAMQAWPRELVASVNDGDWERFLQGSLREGAPQFPEGKLSGPALYGQEQGPVEAGDWQDLLNFSRYWIRAHRVS